MSVTWVLIHNEMCGLPGHTSCFPSQADMASTASHGRGLSVLSHNDQESNRSMIWINVLLTGKAGCSHMTNQRPREEGGQCGTLTPIWQLSSLSLVWGSPTILWERRYFIFECFKSIMTGGGEKALWWRCPCRVTVMGGAFQDSEDAPFYPSLSKYVLTVLLTNLCVLSWDGLQSWQGPEIGKLGRGRAKIWAQNSLSAAQGS